MTVWRPQLSCKVCPGPLFTSRVKGYVLVLAVLSRPMWPTQINNITGNHIRYIICLFSRHICRLSTLTDLKLIDGLGLISGRNSRMRKWLVRSRWISETLSKIEICLLLVCLGLNNCLGRVKTLNFCLGNGHWRVHLLFSL